ncbi:retrovirus-related Pol polyprotein from transposon 17.6 [Trichonephila clavata]|uniref:Retrovirus-related Pol polyprotein from transposon 17.6 n=1 Tax=Trichonephila clavata TaxID=2740835 RepID=A0A8X6I456_TRICU|nr:retrovirus-related Pol polyprotein from transposon 17.6 [Trichonephila clavata]
MKQMKMIFFAESVDSFTPFSNDENDAESGNEIFYVESDSDNLNFNSDYSKIKDEQNNCDSLKKETEREQVLAILLKHRTLFTSDVKIAKVGAHRIRLKPNIERKPFLYRVPESLKIKVDEQIEELLRLDLIEESDAEIAYPIVCVNKKDGTCDSVLTSELLTLRVCLRIFRWKMLWSSYILLEEPISSQH